MWILGGVDFNFFLLLAISLLLSLIIDWHLWIALILLILVLTHVKIVRNSREDIEDNIEDQPQ